VKTGVQCFYNYLKLLDSGFRRNDDHEAFPTFYDFINYDMPDTTDAYTHRIGRTGRAEKTGDAFSLVTREDEAVVRNIEFVLGARLERRRLNDFDYQRPALPGRDNGLSGQRPSPRGQPERAKSFT